MTAVALTIDVHTANRTAPPAALAERLNSSPTKSPEDLAKALESHNEKTAKLRAQHLDAVRDRAARETQRQQEAIARKLRLAATRAEKVQRKIDEATTKMEAKKEASEAERAARTMRRNNLMIAVAEARKAAGEARAHRQAELAAAEHAAWAKHAKAMNDVAAKGKNAVKHALAVVQAHKEKESLDAVTRGEALASRMHAAEARRQLASPPASPERRSTPLHRVRNEFLIQAETRRLALEVSMAKHEEKRAAHLETVMNKARAENAKVEAVAAKVAAVAAGTDEATAAAKGALYAKLVDAEVARLMALKAKYAKIGAQACGPTVILVPLDDVLTPREPPAALAMRLGNKPNRLLATAAARQAGAASRRLMAKNTAQVKVATQVARRSEAAVRVSKALADKAADVQAKSARALAVRALVLGKRAQMAALSRARLAKAQLKREQFAEGMKRITEMKLARAAAASERNEKKTRMVAKTGVVAVRRAAFRSRREALDGARLARGKAATARCMHAGSRRAAFLEARVLKARKSAKSRSSEA